MTSPSLKEPLLKTPINSAFTAGAKPIEEGSRTLVIISVPFIRNTRYLISSRIFEALKREYAILIVSPFCNQESFKREFGGPNVFFLEFDKSPDRLGPLIRYVYAVSEVLRRNGYWFRFRNKTMRYYWDFITRSTQGMSSANPGLSLKSKLINHTLGVLGYSRNSWKWLENIFGSFFYDTKDIAPFTAGYSPTILVQTANWGYQERFLAYCSRKYSFKSILLPYTTDQLVINGYLLSSFDKICAQGPIETRYALDFHGVAPQKISPLGMLWLRNIEYFQEEYCPVAATFPETKSETVLLYAGLTATFFPRVSEFEAVDSLLNAIKTGILRNSRLIYRPAITSPQDIEEVTGKYGSEILMEIQMPQPSCIGISGDSIGDIKMEMVEYIQQIRSIDVLIMSATTTMLFDALYFDIPCIANFTDSTSTLDSIGFTGAYLKNDATLRSAPAMPIAHSLQEMIQFVKEASENPASHQQVKRSTFAEWDYGTPNYVSQFLGLVKDLEHEYHA